MSVLQMPATRTRTRAQLGRSLGRGLVTALSLPLATWKANIEIIVPLVVVETEWLRDKARRGLRRTGKSALRGSGQALCYWFGRARRRERGREAATFSRSSNLASRRTRRRSMWL